jgi:gamma-glutamylcysteine synthetase
MTKYKRVFEEMIRQNQSDFDFFKQIHDQYSLNPQKFKEEFNNQGEKIQMILRRYENQLCRHSESGGFGKFSGNLAEKFWEEVRNEFPKIDEIGLF